MNAGRHKTILPLLLVLLTLQRAFAGSVQISTDRGNRLYRQGKFNEAIKEYDQALIDSPHALEPKFNKANSYYRLDDPGEAMNLYRQVAAESKDMKLVAKAKYNLGNCSFRQGSKQRDSNLQKAIEEMKTAIEHWRSVLDIDRENQKAAKNIEVARLTIKDILDQIKNQPQQPQDPNQPRDSGRRQQQDQQQSQQQQARDPNNLEDNKQNSRDDSNEPEQQEAEQQQQQVREKDEEQQKQKSDATAQEILDKEQRDKKQRQLLQRTRYRKVEKDW